MPGFQMRLGGVRRLRGPRRRQSRGGQGEAECEEMRFHRSMFVCRCLSTDNYPGVLKVCAKAADLSMGI